MYRKTAEKAAVREQVCKEPAIHPKENDNMWNLIFKKVKHGAIINYKNGSFITDMQNEGFLAKLVGEKLREINWRQILGRKVVLLDEAAAVWRVRYQEKK